MGNSASINTNIAAYYSQKNLKTAGDKAQSSIARLSSGNRIVQASDDVAALSIGTVLASGVKTLKQALVNAGQANSMLQIADGGLDNITNILQRQKTLSTQATSGSLSASERSFLNQEFQSLTSEIDRLVNNTKFSSVNLLDGTLGSKLQLASTNAISAAFAAGGSIATASTNAIQAFNNANGASAQGNTAGLLQFVDSANTLLVNGAYLTVNSAVQGAIGQFSITSQVDTVSANLKVTINGIDFTGTVANNATNFVLTNGNTRIQFGTAAFNVTSAATSQTSLNTLNASFASVTIQRTNQVTGVNFTGTALAGVTFNAASGTPMIRVNDSNNAGIRNFKYAGNSSANNNILTVEIGGKTYTATNVADLVQATTVLRFTDGSAQGFQMVLTGLTTNITNIRTSATDQANFINALNQGFSSSAGSVSFAVGSTSADTINVSIKGVNSTTLFGGQTLDISTLAGAQAASSSLDTAIAFVTSVRADVGAQQSRFNFASSNLQTSIQNQDAARGTLLDTDVSAESTEFATQQVLIQAGISVLAQANLLPQNLLKLLG